MKKLEVRGKVFNIELINNYVSKKYSEEFWPLIEELGRLTSSEIEENATKAFYGKKGAELKKAIKEQTDIFNEIKRDTKVNSKEICAMREELIQELLESNEIEYDSKWWNRKTSADDMNDFLLTCMKPDYKLNSKTVKKK